jgi:DNA-directed RNA polymerase specialized sigma24 family protein
MAVHAGRMSEAPSEQPSESSAQWFRTTHWSVVLAARDGEGAQAHAALERLCRAYWPPIYAYLRRLGHAPPDAQDLAQGFFAHFLEHGFVHRLHHCEGRFRFFLLTFLKRFLADERDKAKAQKRGGAFQIVSWDECSLEEQRLGTINPLSAGQTFDRRWAMTVLQRAQDRLRMEYAATGKGQIHDVLQAFLNGEKTDCSYADVAAQLAMPENSVKSAIHRLRRRYGQLIRDEVAQTVESPQLVDEEIRYLLSIVGQ